MRKKIILIIAGIIVGSSTGIGIGIYFWLNPLTGANQNLGSGIVRLEGEFVVIDGAHYGYGTVQIVDLPNRNK
ncbi:MAG: hypothetical protein ACXAAH_16870 [Promethearchaeota archaeon]|jgi:hypothetical protein